jgi:hypothetical protein
MTEAEVVWSHLERFLHGDLPVAAFEAWLYSQSHAVEETIGPEISLSLLSLNYNGPHADHEARKSIEEAYQVYRPGEMARDRARRVATEFLDGGRDLWSTARILSSLRFEGLEACIPDEFVYIDSELDDIPPPEQRFRWDQAAWKRVRGLEAPVLAEYERAARLASVSLLKRLESGAREA